MIGPVLFKLALDRMGESSTAPRPSLVSASGGAPGASIGGVGAAPGHPVGEGVPLHELPLVPVRIDGRHGARGVEAGDLLGRQFPADGAEVLAELVLVARPDDQRGHAGPLGAAS